MQTQNIAYVETHLHCNHDMSSMLMKRKKTGTTLEPLCLIWRGEKIKWNPLIRQAYVTIFKGLRDEPSWFRVMLMSAACPLGLKSSLQSNLNMSPSWYLPSPCPQSPREEKNSLFASVGWLDINLISLSDRGSQRKWSKLCRFMLTLVLGIMVQGNIFLGNVSSRSLCQDFYGVI